jgi:hypothetical protein
VTESAIDEMKFPRATGLINGSERQQTLHVNNFLNVSMPPARTAIMPPGACQPAMTEDNSGQTGLIFHPTDSSFFF